MKAHLGMTGSGFSRSAITRSTLCLSIATALALPVAIPAITPSTAVEQTAEKGTLLSTMARPPSVLPLAVGKPSRLTPRQRAAPIGCTLLR